MDIKDLRHQRTEIQWLLRKEKQMRWPLWLPSFSAGRHFMISDAGRRKPSGAQWSYLIKTKIQVWETEKAGDQKTEVEGSTKGSRNLHVVSLREFCWILTYACVDETPQRRTKNYQESVIWIISNVHKVWETFELWISRVERLHWTFGALQRDPTKVTLLRVRWN